MKIFVALALLFLTTAAFAGPTPYDEKADAKLEIKQALAQATVANEPVIIVFGANWCPDCQALAKAMKSGASAELLAQNFKIVKVSVGQPLGKGQFEKNMDIAEAYGVPLIKGIPAVVIVSPKNEVLYLTRAGEVSDARNMGDQGIYDFFKRVTAPAIKK